MKNRNDSPFHMTLPGVGSRQDVEIRTTNARRSSKPVGGRNTSGTNGQPACYAFASSVGAERNGWLPTLAPGGKRRFAAALLAGSALALPGVVPAQVQEIESVIVEEGEDGSVAEPDVVVDQAGNRYVIGRFDGVVEFGEGRNAQVLEGTNGDLFVAKYDADGNLQWIEEFETDFGGGGLPSATPGGIALDSSENQVENDLYAAGTFISELQVGGQTLTSNDSNPDGFVAQLDPETGEVRWVNQVSGTQPILVNATSANSGNVVVTGRFRGIADFSGQFGNSDSLLTLTPGGDDMFVAKYDFLGGFDFALQAGGDDAEGNDIQATDLRTIVVVGDFFETARFPDRTGQPVRELTSAGSKDGFLAHYNFGGQLLDLLPIGGTDSDGAAHVVQVERGFDTYVAGTFRDTMRAGPATLQSRGENDTYLLRFNPLGDLVERVVHIGGDDTDFARGLAVDADRNVYLAGGFFSSELAIGEGSGAIQLPRTDLPTAYFASFNRELVPAFGQAITGDLRVDGLTVEGSGDLAEVHLATSYRSEVVFGEGDQTIELPAPGGSSGMAVARFAADSGDEESDALFVSTSTNGSVDGLSFRDEDILLFSVSRQQLALVVDGSDIGLGGNDIGAFHWQQDGSLLLSVNAPISLPGLGAVDDSDILRFVPASLGSDTAGTLEIFQRGVDVSLTENSEDIDAIGMDADGRLVISTVGSASVPGSAGDFRAGDEDLLVRNGNVWELFTDGSDIGLTQGSEDVKAVSLDAEGVALSTLGAFSAGELTGGGEDVFHCQLASSGDNTQVTDCAILFDGSENGLEGQSIDAFSFENPQTEGGSVLDEFLASLADGTQ